MAIDSRDIDRMSLRQVASKLRWIDKARRDEAEAYRREVEKAKRK